MTPAYARATDDADIPGAATSEWPIRLTPPRPAFNAAGNRPEEEEPAAPKGVEPKGVEPAARNGAKPATLKGMDPAALKGLKKDIPPLKGLKPATGTQLIHATGRIGHGLIRRLGAQILPRACLLCESPCHDSALCIHCAAFLAEQHRQRCPRCALPCEEGTVCTACSRQAPSLTAVVALADYGPPLDRALGALKFQGQLALAQPLGALLMQHLLQSRPDLTDRLDALVPIPLAGRRLAERGFNQSLQIARGMRASSPAHCPPIRAAWLLRQRHTAPQSTLSRAARLRNLIGAFRVPHPEQIAGKHIALVDDVMTTGSTLHEAARCLLAAGAKDVSALVVARTPDFAPTSPADA